MSPTTNTLLNRIRRLRPTIGNVVDIERARVRRDLRALRSQLTAGQLASITRKLAGVTTRRTRDA